jgi:hypothetical protein
VLNPPTVLPRSSSGTSPLKSEKVDEGRFFSLCGMLRGRRLVATWQRHHGPAGGFHLADCGRSFLVTPMMSEYLCGELHVPYRSPQQYFTNESERDGVNKNDPNLMNHLLTGVTAGHDAQEKCHGKARRALSVFSAAGSTSRLAARVDGNKSVRCKQNGIQVEEQLKATVRNEKEDG